MLRSDYAEGRAKTYVELAFSSGGNIYAIRRDIIPHIARATEDVTYTDSVSLTLPDGTVIDRSRDVDAKILEVVGLDRDQFSQIVMIAQNDFLRFLQSGTDDRVKILRRIFGTGALKFFQESLKTKAREKDEERKAVLRDFEKYEVDPYKRCERFTEWENQIKADEATIKETDDKLAADDEASKDLAARIAVAKGIIKVFSDLAAQREALGGHNAKQDEMNAVGERKGRGEIALRKVKPFADKAGETAKTLAAANGDLETAKTAESAAELILAASKKTLADLPRVDASQEAFDSLRALWEQNETKLKKLTEIKNDYDGIVEKQTRLDALGAELAETEKAILALPSVTEIQVSLDKLKLELAALTEKQTTLAKLQSNFSVISAKQAELTKGQAEFEKLTEQYRTAKKKYDELYELFLRGQAGILSATLDYGKPCPVCGSVEHPAPADALDEDVSESMLKKLSADADKSKGKLDEKTTACASLRAETAALTERFLSDASGLFSETSFATIGTMLVDAIGQTDDALSEITVKNTDDEKTLSELVSQTEALAKRKEEIVPQSTALSAEISTQTARFMKDFRDLSPGGVFETAGADLDTLLSETKTCSDELTAKKNTEETALANLKKDFDSATKQLTASESQLASANTLAVERDNRVKEQASIADTAMVAYKEALSDNGFNDAESYIASLISEADLAAITKTLADYEDAGKTLRREIARLESETTDRAEPDLEKLNAEADELQESIRKLRAGREETKSRLDNITRMLKELKKSALALAKIEKEYAALKGLSDTANGKLDFETYAQMAYFERVLRAANLRLKVMSQNRYVLVRQEEGGDGRKRTGLEIEVADSYTGRSRSANSLSGGESFMASLSLALGLSDVVQQTAGGIHLDAMFIDEGFGSLDAEVLELSVRALSDMAGGNRMVGIISHVAELRERIDKQVRVDKTTSGSKISIVV